MIDAEEIIQLLADNQLPQPMFKKHWEEVYMSMILHTQGEYPERILHQRHNEPDDLLKKRVEMFVPITKSVFSRAANNLYKVLQSSNYVAKAGSQDVEMWLEEADLDGLNFWDFFLSRVLQTMLEDPNGYLAWIPEGEDWVLNQTVTVYPYPYLVHSSAIAYSDKETLVFLSDEVSQVMVNQKTEWTGKVYYVLTDSQFYRLQQYGEKNKNRFNQVTVYNHNQEALPALKLKGDWNTKGFYESFFSGGVGLADEALRQFSDWQTVMVNCAYPTKQIQAVECNAPGCDGGKIVQDDGGFRLCQSCDGTGVKILTGPNAVMLKPVPKGIGSEDAQMQGDVLSYISPNTDIIQYSENAWKGLIKDVEKALGLLYVDEAQSGVAKEVDREQLYSLLSKISPNIFDHLIYNSLWIAEQYIKPNAPIRPTVIAPVDFGTKFESELMDELKQTMAIGGVKELVVQTTKDLVARRYSGDQVENKKVNVLLEYSPLFAYTVTEMQQLLVSGVITIQQVQRKMYADSAIMRLIRQIGDTAFLELPYEQIKDRLDEIIAPMLTTSIPEGVTELPG